MPDSVASNSRRPSETQLVDSRPRVHNCAVVPLHHAASIADSTPTTTLPPTLTPATTTRRSVALPSLWSSDNALAGPACNRCAVASPIPAIITHAPSPDVQEPASDLTTSTGSVPSTTTTLTNTLPPSQSAALRALNAPAFQSHASSTTTSKTAKSTSSRTTLSSQPVVVRTYSGPRHNSRPSSGFNSPRFFGMNGSTSQNTSALSAGLAGRGERLPGVEEFSFSAILRAVDPEIKDAIDAIAEICARSRLSLADEYDAHLPPQGEITGAGPAWAVGTGAMVGRGRLSRIGQGWHGTENTLTAVPEASSSSERLAGESRGSIAGASQKKRSQSAYGSLKSVISGGSDKRRDIDTGSSSQPPQTAGHEAVNTPSTPVPPSINLITTPQASKHLSLDLSSTIKDVPESPRTLTDTGPEAVANQPGHRRNTSTVSMPARTRSSTLSSLTSWIPWARLGSMDAGMSDDATKAEAKLREMLSMSQNPSFVKGKAAMSAA